MLWLLVMFTVVPLFELALLIRIGEEIGPWATIGLVVVTGMVGWALAKREGFRVWMKIQTELGQGHLPGDQLVDALLILVAGVVLVTPGVLTDVTGFLLLIPPVRAVIRNHLKKRFKSKITMVDFTNVAGGFRTPSDDFVDVEAYSTDEAGNDGDADDPRLL